jgi:hypothetical protein
MNVGQYRTLLGDLELKKAEVIQVEDNSAFGYAKTVLTAARLKIEDEMDKLLSLELMPVPTIVSIISSISSVLKAIGESVQLSITATMSDGVVKDVTKSRFVYASFRDYDLAYNNTGKIVSVDAGLYVGDTDKYRVVKTSTGWNVYNGAGTDGLQVVAATDPNTFEIADINGLQIGVKFVTDGLEASGDNWNIDANVALTGTTYTTSNEAVVSVNDDGNVYAIGVGTATVTITNNNQVLTVEVTVA